MVLGLTPVRFDGTNPRLDFGDQAKNFIAMKDGVMFLWNNPVEGLKAMISLDELLSDRPGEALGGLGLDVALVAAGGVGGAKLGTRAVSTTSKLGKSAKTGTLTDDLAAQLSLRLRPVGIADESGQLRLPLTRVDTGILKSSDKLLGVERASSQLLQAVEKRRTVRIALPDSEEMRYLDFVGAEANVGGPTMTHILLRPNPSKAAVLEEFLHGTQSRLGIVERLGVGGSEAHVKSFMIRFQNLLGLSDQDVRILQQLKELGL